jgi:glutamate dehydrogenase
MDRSSDAIRVDARDLRAKVVGEGGNLGFTQRGRIEYARAGGRINADFIDNSAGVDSSDHEVNLKVLLDVAVRRGELAPDARNELLREVTDDVVAHVLYDSFLQAQILTQEERASALRIFAYEDLMDGLEESGMLDRRAEALPASDELADLRRTGAGLVRPELAVLVAYAKRALTDALLDSGLPEDPAFDADLRGYFPPAIVERFGGLLADHPLRRELIATLVANDVVNALGPTFVSGLGRELGARPDHVARAYRVAREVTGAAARWDAIEALDPETVPQDVAWELMGGVDMLVGAIARWYVVHEHEVDVLGEIEAAHGAFERLAGEMEELRSEDWREEHRAIAAALAERGVPEPLARRHAFQQALIHVPDVVAVMRATDRSLEDAARACFIVGEELRLEWLEQQVLALPVGTRTQRWAEQALLDDVLSARRELAQRALEEHPGATPEAAVDAFLGDRTLLRRRLAGAVRALTADGSPDLAGLTLAVRHLRSLAG